MSPFSVFLRNIRKKRGYRQKPFAHLLGYEPSYISALERSTKGPPRRDFIDRLIKGLDLDEEEREQLAQALEQSRRQISLPATASTAEYTLLHQLEPQLGHLHPLQIQLMQLILSIPEAYSRTGLDACRGAPDLQRTHQEAPKM